MTFIKTVIKSTLIIDQEEYKNSNLKSIFKENELTLDIVTQEHDYMAMIDHNKYDCIVIDSDLPRNQTEKIIDDIKVKYPSTIVIILLKLPDYEKVIKFVRLGADDFIVKPFTWEDIEIILTYYYY